MEIFAPTPENLSLDAIGAYAQRVETLGYDGLFVPDAVHDGLLLACQALSATTRLKVGTSVLVAFPRSPMNVALAAWDLQRLSGGRFELGLGTQIRQNIEERYSARWLPPVAGMREYLGALRAIFHSFRTGAPLRYSGEYFQFSRLQPFFNPGPIEAPDVPLMMGAVGPKMLELVGAVADGVHTHPTNTSRRYLRDAVLPRIAAGCAQRETALPAPRICINTLVATGPDAASVSAERERFRHTLAFLFSTPAYWPSLDLFGWQTLGPHLQQLTREGRWQDMSHAFGDEMLDEFLVSATYADLPRQLLSRFGDLVDRLTITVPAASDQDAEFSKTLGLIRAQAQGRAHSNGVL